MSGDQMTGGSNGIWVSYGAVELSEIQISDAVRYGIFVSTTDSVAIREHSGLGRYGSHHCSRTTKIGGSDEQGYAGTGIMVTADAITISEVSVEGYNGAGILLNEMDNGTASLQDVNLSNNGRHGLVIYGLDTTADEVTVQGLIQTVDQGEGTLQLRGPICGRAQRIQSIDMDRRTNHRQRWVWHHRKRSQSRHLRCHHSRESLCWNHGLLRHNLGARQ